ncbi:MAG: cytochrome c1, partial [Pseudomonas sp.]
MRKLLICALALFTHLPVMVYAASEGGHTESIEIDLENKGALQRGAKYFVNYCQSCHSATYMRYSRLAEDLEIDPKLVEQNLIFGEQEIGDTMSTA